MRKTKIVCTIGPACDNEETLERMCLAGMNVARLNFSHGTHPEQQRKMDLVKKVREKLNLPIAIMLDTKGSVPHTHRPPNALQCLPDMSSAPWRTGSPHF